MADCCVTGTDRGFRLDLDLELKGPGNEAFPPRNCIHLTLTIHGTRRSHLDTESLVLFGLDAIPETP